MNSPLVQLYWTSADYNQAPCITNHNWALWNVYDSMYRIVQDQLLRSKMPFAPPAAGAALAYTSQPCTGR